MSSRFIRVAACGTSCLRPDSRLTGCRDHMLCIRSPTSGHVGCFCLLAIEKNVAMNTGLQMSVHISASVLFVLSNYPEVGLVDSMSILYLIFLGNHHTAPDLLPASEHVPGPGFGSFAHPPTRGAMQTLSLLLWPPSWTCPLAPGRVCFSSPHCLHPC